MLTVQKLRRYIGKILTRYRGNLTSRWYQVSEVRTTPEGPAETILAHRKPVGNGAKGSGGGGEDWRTSSGENDKKVERVLSISLC